MLMRFLKKLTETVAIPIIDAAVDLAIPDSDPRKPMFKAVLYSIKGSYGFLASFMPEEAEDFMKQVGEHREEIATQLLKSKEFQQALIITFDSLIRTRSEKKRRIVKQVFFKGYIPAKKHEEFELERFYSRSQEISMEAVAYLHFIKKEIMPSYIAYIEKENSLPSNVGKKTLTTWNTPISTYIFDWISSNYDVNNTEVKKKYPNLPHDSIYGKLKQELPNKIQELDEMAAEFLSLGIFSSTGSKLGGGFTYSFTSFGLRYLDYLDEK